MLKNKFGGVDHDEDKIIILLASSISKKLTRVVNLTSVTKKSNQIAKNDGKDVWGYKYLIPGIKKVFKPLQHAFIQTLILEHFDLKKHI